MERGLKTGDMVNISMGGRVMMKSITVKYSTML